MNKHFQQNIPSLGQWVHHVIYGCALGHFFSFNMEVAQISLVCTYERWMYNTNICKLYILSNKLRDVGSTLKGGRAARTGGWKYVMLPKIKIMSGWNKRRNLKSILNYICINLVFRNSTFTKIYSMNGISIKKWHQDIDELDELLAY